MKRKAPKRRNVHAAALSNKLFRPKVVASKKGYKRKKKTEVDDGVDV